MEALIIFFVLMGVGYTVGTFAEKRHYRSIHAREQALLHLPAVTTRTSHYTDAQIESADLVLGSTVISVDYFKQFVAVLRKIFGGTVRSYETLLDRARREAVLRMKEVAGDAVVIVNVRIEAAPIGKKARKGNVSCVEAVAYGTALYLKPP
ncbi:MAG TPA: heavy metal-binding domain-containing protein [Desulfobacterales bacterium]|nr:heavy metal-binding domain-containing protein [Desulfobacterales bacterium]